MPEYKLENPKTGNVYEFSAFYELINFIKSIGELAGWIITVHHM